MENWEVEQVKKGFNQGYLLAKHRPEFVQVIKDNKQGAEIPYFKAILDGAKQYEIEKHKEMEKAQGKTKEPAKQKTPIKPVSKPPTKGR
jgi:hypothetical protein